jgi:hypothetical protein
MGDAMGFFVFHQRCVGSALHKQLVDDLVAE